MSIIKEIYSTLWKYISSNLFMYNIFQLKKIKAGTDIRNINDQIFF